MATEIKEVRIAHTGISILCDKSGGGQVPSIIQSNTKKVFIDNGYLTTKADKVSTVNIVPFPSCDVGKMCGVCVPAVAGDWDKTAEDTVNTEKQIPLVEDSILKCTNGGKITFKFGALKKPPEPNVVDSAKAKINSAVNTVVKKATELAKGATESISGALNGLKPVIENTKLAGLADNLDTQIQRLNELKKETDTKVKDFEKEVTETRKKIEAKVTGTKYIPPKETEEKADQAEGTTTSGKKNIDLENEEEEKRNTALFNQSTNDAIKEFEDYLNAQLLQAAMSSSTNQTESVTVQTMTNLHNTQTQPDEKRETNTFPNSDSLTANNYINRLESAIASSKKLGLDKNEETQKALTLLRNTDALFASNVSTVVDKAKVIIKNERSLLNVEIQNKIDEELKKLGYAEKLKKYKSESNDLQNDIDKASLALKSVGDFGGFIDGLKNKYLGKLGEKYSKSLNQLSKNLTTLNTSLDGLSYVASGFPKGDVFTHVIREKEEKKNEDEDGEDNKKGDGSIFGSLQDVLNDRNKEPKILRIYTIYGQDDPEGEDYKKGDDITVEVIPPNLPVTLIIVANLKAKGAIVDLDLEERSSHYDPVDKSGKQYIREGLFEDIKLAGDSPDFDAGWNYDHNDPNFSIHPEKGKKLLNDKTTIDFISKLPLEEEQEEIIT